VLASSTTRLTKVNLVGVPPVDDEIIEVRLESCNIGTDSYNIGDWGLIVVTLGLISCNIGTDRYTLGL